MKDSEKAKIALQHVQGTAGLTSELPGCTIQLEGNEMMDVVEDDDEDSDENEGEEEGLHLGEKRKVPEKEQQQVFLLFLKSKLPTSLNFLVFFFFLFPF